ncbi:riboflavin kinase [Microbacterium capsulatum]|uniref:riboflavin kinase n=1 Tax=Microbacterium capsulatum TaxID=3041921 RepID=A0ABU0XEN5_9MICO|nr:riboflavin kinase [Microbacterium sp. ASV81]MDQ4213567.1 riboflavin kinase [Microbacterium sp. ASV81]
MIPELTGLVVQGDGRGRALGFPTANLHCDGGGLPADGIYAAWAAVDGEAREWEASVSVGANPTFDGLRERRVEVHLHDADLDLYGLRMRIRLVAFLRPTLRFDDAEALIAQTVLDVEQCRRILAGRVD